MYFTETVSILMHLTYL